MPLIGSCSSIYSVLEAMILWSIGDRSKQAFQGWAWNKRQRAPTKELLGNRKGHRSEDSPSVTIAIIIISFLQTTLSPVPLFVRRCLSRKQEVSSFFLET